MGLMGGPASFSRLMDLVMRGLDFVLTYIDDCLIFSCDLEQHIQHIEAALRRFREFNLKINLAKCNFGAAAVQYLGQTLSPDGIRPGHDKTKAIAEMAAPTTPCWPPSRGTRRER